MTTVVRWASITATSLLVLGILIWYGLRIGLSKSDWAAWLQAAGSVGAIVFAGWLPAHQARRQQIDNIKNRRLNVGYLAVDLLDLLDGYSVGDSHQGLVYPNRAVEDLFSRLRGMQADISDGFSSEHLMLLRRVLIAFDTRFSDADNHGLSEDDAAFLLCKKDRVRQLLTVARAASRHAGEHVWNDTQ